MIRPQLPANGRILDYGAPRNSGLGLRSVALDWRLSQTPRTPKALWFTFRRSAPAAAPPAAKQQVLVIEEPAPPPEPEETPPPQPPGHRRPVADRPAAVPRTPKRPPSPMIPPRRKLPKLRLAEVPALEPRESSAQEAALRQQVQRLQEDVRQRMARLNPAGLSSNERKTLDDASTFLAQSTRALREQRSPACLQPGAQSFPAGCSARMNDPLILNPLILNPES